MKAISGGKLIAQMLKEEGVEKVFGIIDGTYFGFYSNLKKLGIELITPRHETCVAHMAGAYARLTGKIGVCMASNGPGVANVLPGVAVEQGEGNRVLLITSSRRAGIVCPDRGGAFQCFDQTGVIGAMSKSSEAIPDLSRVPEMVRRALRRCYQGRPGVVHIDVPEDIMNGKEKFDAIWKAGQYRRAHPIAPPINLVDKAADMLIKARFPLIHAGSGVIHAQAFPELKRVAEILSSPVTTSWGGRGALTEDSELAIPMVHVEVNNLIRNAADLVLTLGSRMGETDWWGKPPYWAPADKQKMIQVDIDEEILGANKPADLTILADVKAFLEDLYKKLEERKGEISLAPRKEELGKFKKKQEKHRSKLDESLKDLSTPMHSAQVAHICQDFFKDDAVLVADGGNTAVWANFYHHLKIPGTFLSTFKFGMLGAGVAQVLGAAVARPDKQVYCIIGDGAMAFHCQEIETAVRNNLKAIYLVLCDKQWGMVKMNQQFALRPIKTLIKKSLGPDETINADLGEIEFDKLAQSMGAHGERVSDPKELKGALERCQKADKCAVIHIDVEPVKHMWAPSLIHFKKMHEEPAGR